MSMTDSGDKQIKGRVSELVTYNFSVTKCPAKVYKKFTQFCKEECNDNYSFGLKLLLDGMESNIKETLLYEQIMLLQERVQTLEEKSGQEKEKSKIKTFGGTKNG